MAFVLAPLLEGVVGLCDRDVGSAANVAAKKVRTWRPVTRTSPLAQNRDVVAESISTLLRMCVEKKMVRPASLSLRDQIANLFATRRGPDRSSARPGSITLDLPPARRRAPSVAACPSKGAERGGPPRRARRPGRGLPRFYGARPEHGVRKAARTSPRIHGESGTDRRKDSPARIRRAVIAVADFGTVSSKIVARPLVGAMSPVSILIVVVLPAPFGPKNP